LKATGSLTGHQRFSAVHPRSRPCPTGTRFTVPILFDKKTQTVVNNESSEIMRDLNAAFNDFSTAGVS